MRPTKSIPASILACLGAVAASGGEPAAPNTWVGVTPKYEGAPDGGTIWPSQWNPKGTYDPATGRVIVMDRWQDKTRGITIYANAALAYDPAANTCTVLKVSNWKQEPTPTGGYRTVELPANKTDPTPVDRHPMGCLALVPELNALYLVNGLNQSAPMGHPADTWQFDLAKNKWTLVAAKYNGQVHPDNPSMAHMMEYDPESKLVVYFGSTYAGGYDMWTFDPATAKWRDIANITMPPSKVFNGIAYDSKRKLIMVLSGENLCAYSTAKNEWKRLKPCPNNKSEAPGLSYDSKNDVFLATASAPKAKSAATLIYDPAKDEWGELAGAELPAQSNWNSVTYAPKHDVFVYQGPFVNDKPAWFLFRYDPKTAKFRPPSADQAR